MKENTHSDQNPEEAKLSHDEENPKSEMTTPPAEETTPEDSETEVAEEPLKEEATAVTEIEEVAAEIEIQEPEKMPESAEVEEAPVTEVVAEVEETPVAEVEEAPAAEVEETPVAEVEETPVAEVEEIIETPEAEAEETIVPEVVAEVETAEVPVQEASKVQAHEEAEEDEEEVEVAEAIDLDHRNRMQLVELLEETVKNEDANAIKNMVALIKVAYLKRSNEERESMYQKAAAEEEAESFETTDPLEERFKAAFNIYKHNKFLHAELLEKEKVHNLEAKKQILDELKTLISSEETLKKTYDDFKVLQDKWKSIGMVPKNEAPGMWQNYHFLIEKFFDKVKINKELKDLDLRKNLEHKIELCEKAEELIIETSITKAFKRLQELHEEWKELGPVPQDKREEVWDRFKTASDKINERRHEFYGKIQEEQDANYGAKIVLCEQAEQLVSKEYSSIKQWQESTQQVNELLKMWKSIGQASPKLNNEVWLRFKGQLDNYFAIKKDFFGKLKEQQLHNYNLKVDLCAQAEALRQSTEWRNASRDLINLQEEWKKIGPVPRKHSDKIWKRFRAACDEFFQRKSEFFKTMQSAEGENLNIKLELIKKLENFEYTEDRQANLDTVKELQRVWMETGHVPIKEKDRLHAEYKTAVNKIYDKLKMEASEQRFSNYRNRFDNVKEQPDAHRIINKERNTLQSKIDELKEEILLWENNIGFFANSKQANVLKSEFEAKIAKAKEELAGMEAKKKFLQKAAREQEQQDQQKQ
ncbi:MAG: DUF349 domain-containing protein [Bacteroidales bacterium]|nr:DUF349 domain-containing protein [Bacteroidales bacterium]